MRRNLQCFAAAFAALQRLVYPTHTLHDRPHENMESIVVALERIHHVLPQKEPALLRKVDRSGKNERTLHSTDMISVVRLTRREGYFH